MKLLSSPLAFFLSSRRLAPWRGLAAGALLFAPLALLSPSAKAAAPSNDNFAAPLVFTGATGSLSGTTGGATRELDEPYHADDYGGASVWFTWTPTVSAQALFTTSGSNFDTLLAVYTGNSVGNLTEVISDDDYGGLASQVTFVALAGTTYHIAVDGYAGRSGSYILQFTTNPNTNVPLITSATKQTIQVGTLLNYRIVASNNPTSFAAAGLPSGITLNTSTGVISGTPTTTGKFQIILGATNASGSSQSGLVLVVSSTPVHANFFRQEANLGSGAYYLALPNGNPFGYYSYLADENYIYHFDMGYEYVFDASDTTLGIYLYDFKSRGFFYTSPSFPFPYLYDFSLRSTVYYYPDPSNSGHYNTNGVRYFYVFNTGRIISK